MIFDALNNLVFKNRNSLKVKNRNFFRAKKLKKLEKRRKKINFSINTQSKINLYGAYIYKLFDFFPISKIITHPKKNHNSPIFNYFRVQNSKSPTVISPYVNNS
jgi:hypothetical protein